MKAIILVWDAIHFPVGLSTSEGYPSRPGNEGDLRTGSHFPSHNGRLHIAPDGNTLRRGSCPLQLPKPEFETEATRSQTKFQRTTSLDEPPCTSQRYGILLGTAAAKEAAKSFWNMDMLQQSLEKIVHYTIQERYSPSLDSLGSSIDSDDVQSPPAHRSPQPPPHIHLPPLPVSAPSSPLASPKEGHGTKLQHAGPSTHSSPLLVAGSSSLPNSLNPSPQHSPSVRYHGHLTPPFLSPGVNRRKVYSATTFRLKPLLRPAFSIEGKQLRFSSKQSPKLLPMRKSSSCHSFLSNRITCMNNGMLTPWCLWPLYILYH